MWGYDLVGCARKRTGAILAPQWHPQQHWLPTSRGSPTSSPAAPSPNAYTPSPPCGPTWDPGTDSAPAATPKSSSSGAKHRWSPSPCWPSTRAPSACRSRTRATSGGCSAGAAGAAGRSGSHSRRWGWRSTRLGSRGRSRAGGTTVKLFTVITFALGPSAHLPPATSASMIVRASSGSMLGLSALASRTLRVYCGYTGLSRR